MSSRERAASLPAAVAACLACCAASTGVAQPIAWTQRLVPGPGEGYTRSAFDSHRRVTVCAGGTIGSSGYSFSTWEWDGIAWTAPSHLGPRPSPRSVFAVTFDSWRGVTVLYGGQTLPGGTAWSDETWEWDGTIWTLRATGGPPRLSVHAMAFDSVRGVTVLHGGAIDGTSYSGQTWEWDGTSWTLRAMDGPAEIIRHGMAFDSARGVTVLFGGQAGPNLSSDTWEWDGIAWRRIALYGPPAMHSVSLAYDSRRGVTVLYGGATYSGVINQTWEWNGREWSQRPISGPPSGGGYAFSFDEFRGRTVLFGGSSGWQTWELDSGGPCISIATQPQSQPACTASPAVFTPIISGTGPFTYHWQVQSEAFPPSPAWIDVIPGLNTNPPGGPDAFIAQGAQSASLQVSPIPGAMTPFTRQLRCIIDNACGSATTSAATLTICAADFNCSGGTTVQDIYDFLSAWNVQAGQPAGSANINAFGGVTVQDIYDFLGAWNEGCP